MLRLPLAAENCPVIEIVPDQIVTRRIVAERAAAGRLHGAFDPERDVLLIASIERHRASGRIGLGLVSGFGLTSDGALGSSVAHDSHNLIIAGTNAADMLVCARALAEHGGGFVVAAEGAGAGHRAAAGRRPALARDRRDGLPPARRGQSTPPRAWDARSKPRSERSRSWHCRSFPSCGSPPEASSTSPSRNSSSSDKSGFSLIVRPQQGADVDDVRSIGG